MRRVLRVAALLLLLPSVLSSQTAIALTEPAYATAPPAMNTTKLPPGFIGQNPWEIYESLAAVGGPRSEFETTEAYAARLAAAPRRMVAATAELWSGDASLNYDADKARLTACLLLSNAGLMNGGRTFPQSFPLLHEETGSGTYRRNDLYGASGAVRATYAREVRLAINSGKDVPFKKYYGAPELRFEVPMTPAQAMQAKGEKQLGVLVFFAPAPPYVTTYQKTTGPAPNWLTRTTTEQFFIFGQIKAVWFYNKTDGAIYEKWQPKK